MTINVIHDATPASARPRALIESYRAAFADEQAAKPAFASSRRPQIYPPLSLGQVFRAAILLVTCLLFAQLVNVGHASEERAPSSEATVK